MAKTRTNLAAQVHRLREDYEPLVEIGRSSPLRWGGQHLYADPSVSATTSSSMDRLISGDLLIDPKPGNSAATPSDNADDNAIVLEWRGRSTDRQPARAILPFITPFLERALHLKVPLRMHFENLEHMNSSTITAVIQIIQEARARGTRLVLVYSPEKRWQKLGFEALRVFVKDDGLLELTKALASAAVAIA